MDRITPGLRQLAEWFRSMTPAARLSSALLLAVTVASLVWLLRGVPTAAREYLLGGRVFNAHEIADMEAAFAKAGLNDWEATGNRLRVPRGERFRYLAALAEHQALPHDFDTVMEEMIRDSSPFESRQLRETRFKFALQKELAQVVSQVSGIERATVKYDEVRKGGLSRERLVRAMAAVRAEGRRGLTAQQVRTIRDTIAFSISGLRPEDVMVTDLNTGRSFPAGVEDEQASRYAQTQRVFEQRYEEKIRRALSMIPDVAVTVAVDLRRPATAADTEPVLWPRAVRASVGVPRSYFVHHWRRRYPNGGAPPYEQLEASETSQLQHMLLTLLASEDVDTQIRVGTYAAPVSEPVPAPAEPADAVRTWLLENWQRLVLVALALFGLGLLRSILRSGAAERPTVEPPDPQRPSVTSAEGVESALAGWHVGDSSLRQQLAEQVRRDPAAAANQIRDWVESS